MRTYKLLLRLKNMQGMYCGHLNNKFRISVIASILLIFIIVGSSCSLSNIYVENYTFPKWVVFYIGTALLLIYSAIRYYKIEIYIGCIDLLMGCISLVLIVFVISKASQFNDLMVGSVFILFCVACKFNSKFLNILNIASISFICSAIISSVFSIIQLAEGKDITGCYDNLVGLNITLLLGIISIFNLLRSRTHKKCLGIILLSLILVFITLVLMTKSRLAIMAIIIGSINFFNEKKKYLIISMLIIISMISLFDVKKQESTYGRGFILKTSLTLLCPSKNLFMGYGESGYKQNYMMRQYEDLKIESETMRDRASNIVHPLNEFVLMSVKYGILFTILIFIILTYFIFNKTINPFAKSILLIVTTFMCFSYPLRYPISWIAIGIACVSVINMVVHRRRFKFGIYNSIVLLSTGVILIICVSNKVLIHKNWKETYVQSVLGQKQKALYNYRLLSEKINTDEFIYNYSSYLYQLGKGWESKSILSNIDRVDYETKMLSGKINASLQLYKEALCDFEIAHGMCPNRFTPLYEIYKIYEKTNNTYGKEKYAKIIKNKKIKIPSPQIQSMIDYVINRKQLGN